MNYNVFTSVFLILSILVFSIFTYLSIRSNYKKHRDEDFKKPVISPFHIFLIGVFVSILLNFFIIFYAEYSGDIPLVSIIKGICSDVFYSIKLFVLGSDISVIDVFIDSFITNKTISIIYNLYSLLLCVIAPCLSAGVILSLFKDLITYVRYLLAPNGNIYILSELNEKSIIFAENIKKEKGTDKKKPIIVFAGVNDQNTDLSYKANILGFYCFKKNVDDINLRIFKGNVYRKFFFISEDEDKNLEEALSCIEICKKNECLDVRSTELYVWATNVESETLLDSVDKGHLKVRRIDEYRNFSWNVIFDENIFDFAVETNVNGKIVKELNVVIVGFGKFGREITKTLLWASQLDGYKLSIHIFDSKKSIDTSFKTMCPEIIKTNHLVQDKNPQYDIYFHNENDIKDYKFIDDINKIKNITNVFVQLGTDKDNIETAMKLRSVISKNKLFNPNMQAYSPQILSIVYNDLKTEIIGSCDRIINYADTRKEKHYNIKLIGNFKSRFTLKLIEQLEFEERGFACHKVWANKQADVNKQINNFDKIEYFRRSSITEALHMMLMEKLGFYEKYSESEIHEMKHKRWIAYMRAEGYEYNNIRSVVGKTHNWLIPIEKKDE